VPPNTGGGYRYVALGDSYSSGEGAISTTGDPSFDPSTDRSGNQCHRSLNAYPELLSTEPQVNSIPFGFVFSACSGARIANFVKKLPYDGGWNEGPQLDAIASANAPNASTGLVTLSVGGNDVGFVPDLEACIHGFDRGFSGCQAQISQRLKDGTKLLSQGGRVRYDLKKMDNWNFCPGCSPVADNVVDVPSLAQLYTLIHKRAPNAKIKVMGYPQLFPKDAASSCVVGTFINQFNQHLDYRLEPWEMNALHDGEVTLNKTIKAQVDLVKGRDIPIDYVDSFSSFAGHGPCDTKVPLAPWINGLIFKGPLLTNGSSAFSFHPNQAGQAEFERLMLSALG
jgi:hypothetical protein